MDAESRTELGNFIALFEAHKGERLTLTPGQGRVLLMLLKKMFDDLARRLNGEWKKEDEMSELKPCPFCGSEPYSYHDNDTDFGGVKCNLGGCACSDIEIDEICWNTRPIEDALRARIAELEAEIERLTVHSDIERQDDKSPNDTQTQTIVYGKWIPVSERLPEDGREVLVFAEGLITAGSHCQCGAAFNDDDVLVETPTWLLGIEGEVYGCDAYDAVTHWMPLPEPPEAS